MFYWSILFYKPLIVIAFYVYNYLLFSFIQLPLKTYNIPTVNSFTYTGMIHIYFVYSVIYVTRYCKNV